MHDRMDCGGQVEMTLSFANLIQKRAKGLLVRILWQQRALRPRFFDAFKDEQALESSCEPG
jgi:hypothetical protein